MRLYPELNVRSLGFACLRVALLTYVLYGLILYVGQDSMLYFPEQQPFAECDDLSPAERITMNGTRGYFFQNGSSTKLAVLYHGNAGRACDRAYYQSALTHAGYSWLMVEYTGYAGDGHKPTSQSVLEDVSRTVAWTKDQNFSHIAVLGESIGAGAASYHAFIGEVDQLILLTPFARLSDVAQDYYPVYPIGLLMRDDFDNAAWAAAAGDVFIIYGTTDTIIPNKHAIALFNALPEGRKRSLAINGDHNDVPAFGETQVAIMRFLTEESEIGP